MAAATYKPDLVALIQYLDQPEDAYVWQEYTVGIGGRKAEREFNTEERGRVNY
jgi:hypothetical protein